MERWEKQKRLARDLFRFKSPEEAIEDLRELGWTDYDLERYCRGTKYEQYLKKSLKKP